MPERIISERNFHRMSGTALSKFGTGVNEGVANNPTEFDPAKTPAPPLTHTLMLGYITTYEAAYDAYDKGGTAQKPAYDTATEILMASVDKFADYVDVVAGGDPKIIIKGGFTPVHAQPAEHSVTPGQAKEVTVVNNDVSGVLESECESFGIGHHYVCFAVEGAPFPTGMQTDANGMFIIPATFTNRVLINLTNGRKKTFTGLTKGIEYYFYYVVINSAGVSPLSVVVSKMCS